MITAAHLVAGSSLFILIAGCGGGSGNAGDGGRIGSGGTPGGGGGKAGSGGTAQDGGGSGGASDAAGDQAGADTAVPDAKVDTYVAPDTSIPNVLSLPTSTHIVVDQFGYLPNAEKIAVVRSPKVGFDTSDAYAPGSSYAVVNTTSNAVVFQAAPVAWNGGATDTASGDQAWWVDFSSYSTPGSYVVVDQQHSVRSYEFSIATDVYKNVLKAAVRMLYYQRAGQAKSAAHAGASWADGASHVGANQDHACRRFLDKNNAATAKDLWGGWYDAGDLNKYTPWTAGYVIALLHAYAERPSIWTDDYNIPESGNGVPDIVDEAKWGLDFLVRMQQSDGSVLSIVGEASGSPPSSATGPSYYGDASTNATLRTAAALAYAAVVLKKLNNANLTTYANGLQTKAESAWAWALANPAVIFHNNSSSNGTSGLGAGDQETDDAGRATAKLMAAVYLFAATGKSVYQTHVDANYAQLGFVKTSWLGPWDPDGTLALLDYATTPSATASAASAIKASYLSAVKTTSNLNTVVANNDPYGAFLDTGSYTWGSNATKCRQGLNDYNVVAYGLDASLNADATKAAARYVHYIHGVNPLQLVYLTNMKTHGAERSANEIFHTWFSDGTSWDSAATSTYGPAPGYMPGGPNPSYDWDGCCATSSCGSTANNAICTSTSINPPKGQPAAKSYKDFNTGWPLGSWSISEPSDGYQVEYIRLLSKLIP